MAESGLEREKSQPARLASLALFYFFRARGEPVHLQTVKTLPGLPLLFSGETELLR